MRIATSNAYDAQVDAIQRRQTELYDSQNQLTTGLRVSKASDDPAAAARAERALASIGRTEATQRAVEASSTAMSLTENALSDANDLLQQAREAVVASGNATYGDDERADMARQIRAIRSQLLGVANRADANGNFLFGGQGATAAPFVDQPGGVAWRSVAGEARVPADEQFPTSIDGQGAWMQGRTGNGVFVTSADSGNSGNAWIDGGSVLDAQALTDANYQVRFTGSGDAATYTVYKDGVATSLANVPYEAGHEIAIDGMSFAVSGHPADGDQFDIGPSTPSSSVFDVLDRIATQLETPRRASGDIVQANVDALRDIDSSMARMQTTRAGVGDTLSRLDSAAGRLSQTKLAAQTEQSNATDLDMAQAISRYKTKETSYDAALKSYAMIQRLSLFDYVNS